MDKTYDFSWIISEIDNCLILKIANKNKTLGIYAASKLLTNDLDELNVKFAGVGDLINFISYSVVRFTNVSNNQKFIDIPIRKLYELFMKSNSLVGRIEKCISIKELDAFIINDEDVISDNYFVYAYKINEESDELACVINITYNYNNLGMQEKFDALSKINLVNYQMTDGKKNKL